MKRTNNKQKTKTGPSKPKNWEVQRKPKKENPINLNPIVGNHWEMMKNEIDGIFYKNHIATRR